MGEIQNHEVIIMMKSTGLLIFDRYGQHKLLKFTVLVYLFQKPKKAHFPLLLIMLEKFLFNELDELGCCL